MPKLIDGLPSNIYDAVEMTGFFTGPNTRQTHWKCLAAALKVLAAIDAEYPDNARVLHRRTNRLDEAMELWLKFPTLRAAKTGVLSSPKHLAAACIAVMPKKVNFDTPFGSACISAWTRGNRAYATGTPKWSAALRAFEKAAAAERTAPRTHSEGRLKSQKFQNALVALGRKAPWYGEAIALASSS